MNPEPLEQQGSCNQNPPSNVTPIGSHEDSDLQLVRRTLRQIIKGQTPANAIVVQACNTMLRAIEVREDLSTTDNPPAEWDFDPAILTDDQLKAIANLEQKGA